MLTLTYSLHFDKLKDEVFFFFLITYLRRCVAVPFLLGLRVWQNIHIICMLHLVSLKFILYDKKSKHDMHTSSLSTHE